MFDIDVAGNWVHNYLGSSVGTNRGIKIQRKKTINSIDQAVFGLALNAHCAI